MVLNEGYSSQLPIRAEGGLGLSFADGVLHYIDPETGRENPFRINLVKYRLEEKNHEKGIYVIINCELFGARNELIYSDREVIGEKEFNFSDKDNYMEVQEYLSERYQVSPGIIVLDE